MMAFFLSNFVETPSLLDMCMRSVSAEHVVEYFAAGWSSELYPISRIVCFGLPPKGV